MLRLPLILGLSLLLGCGVEESGALLGPPAEAAVPSRGDAGGPRGRDAGAFDSGPECPSDGPGLALDIDRPVHFQSSPSSVVRRLRVVGCFTAASWEIVEPTLSLNGSDFRVLGPGGSDLCQPAREACPSELPLTLAYDDRDDSRVDEAQLVIRPLGHPPLIVDLDSKLCPLPRARLVVQPEAPRVADVVTIEATQITPPRSAVAFRWSFRQVPDLRLPLNDADTTLTSFRANRAGQYQVELAMTDACGGQVRQAVTIIVAHQR